MRVEVQGSKHDLLSWPDDNKQAWQHISCLSRVRSRPLARDLDLSDHHILLEQNSFGNEEDEGKI